VQSQSRPLPATFGRFVVDGLIGEGGMGTVYRATDPILQRTVAIKTIHTDFADPAALERFRREAQACAGLQHPNIVTVYEAGTVDETVFIVMECLKGANLSQTLQENRLSFEQKIAVLIRILDALAFAHQAGIVHRDVKPANVHVLPDLSVKLLDFGLARVAQAGTLTQSNIVAGTPFYASPEQLCGERVDARTDVYSAGALGYEMFASRRAFDGDSIGTVVLKVLSAQVPEIDSEWTRAFPALEQIIRRAMERSVDARYQSAAEMRSDVEAFLTRSRGAIAARQRELDADVRQFAVAETVKREVAQNGSHESGDATLAWPPQDAPGAALPVPEGIAAPASDRADEHRGAALAGSPADAPRRSRRGLIYGSAVAALFAAALATPLVYRRGEPPPRSLEPAALAASPAVDAPKPAGIDVPRPAEAAESSASGAAAASPTAAKVAVTKPAVDSPPAAAAAVASASALRPPIPLPAPATAKELFYAPATAASNGSGTRATADVAAGLRYRLVSQLASGQEAEVVPATSFTSGDKVRFAFESNVDGYLYVIEEGSSGQWRVLFPNPQINGGTNFIRRSQSYPVPSSAWFVFDEQPGTERLFVLLSKRPMRELPGLNQAVTEYASVDPSVVQRLSREMKSRDLIFQSDAAPQRDNTGGEAAVPAVYVVNRDKLAKEVATTIELVHK
jgi:hypothetical protein